MLLEAREKGTSVIQDTETSRFKPEAATLVPSMHAYVNRLLKKWSRECSAAGMELSSHSFRRGAAQSAISNSSVNTPWIIDRGDWSITSVSKAFNYIVSTTQDDQHLGKILAGWGSKTKLYLPTLRSCERVVSRKIMQLQDTLYQTAFGFPDHMNLRDDVFEVTMAVVLLHYSDMLKLSPDSPYIAHMISMASQSLALTIQGDLIERSRSPVPLDPAPASSFDDVVEKQSALIQKQMDLIGHSSSQIQHLTQRVTSLEGPGTISEKTSATASPPQLMSGTRTPSAAPHRRSHAKSLSTVWATSLPWKQTSDRRRYHEDEVKVAVAFMRIFLPEGYGIWV
ncbi:hypothetical protein PR003_g2752 [Phytophthora rubi]|uniref:Uncharacterized protein n=1 Tax=Phytophthora rubi TaxID=129364 RepID=A0A6A3P9I3_9STRA|nr:hypothetical protein PR001_g2216 [Phytophthora rubi]KAE9355628.1 hypothetical protein PR003_g2752 [Phytophthora rubi]